MKLIANGKEVALDGALTVSQLLAHQNVSMPEMVSVELNGRILRRSEFDHTVLSNGDKVEFIYFMGGGNVTDRPAG
jgi:sulfur carrier protein